MGTHGRGFVAHVVLGSVAEKVVRTAPCPVLTVRNPQQGFVVEDTPAEDVVADTPIGKPSAHTEPDGRT